MKRATIPLTAALLLAAGCGSQEAPASRAEAAAAPATDATSSRPPPSAEAVEGTATESAPAAGGMRIALSQGSPSYLVDAAGASLYALKGNRDGTRCDAVCESAWPPVMSSQALASAASGVDGARLATLRRADGRMQVTYAQQPLYRYAGDGGAGRTSGHSVKDKWGEWSLLAASGEALTAEPPAVNEAERGAAQTPGGSSVR